YSSTSTKLASNHFISPGKRRVVTPGSAITRPTENICGNSTCPKTPQDYSKEGRLKPIFANNVDIPFASARRLRPCPRKASTRSVAGRQQQHTYWQINMLLIHSLHQLRRLIATTSFVGASIYALPQSHNLQIQPFVKKMAQIHFVNEPSIPYSLSA